MSDLGVDAIVVAIAVVAVLVLVLRLRGGKELPPSTEAEQQVQPKKASQAGTSSGEKASVPQVDEAKAGAPQRNKSATTEQVASSKSKDVQPAATQRGLAATESAPSTSDTSAVPSILPQRTTSWRPSTPSPDDALSAFKRGLSSTRGGFVSRLSKLLKGKPKLDEALFDEIEEILLSADIGAATTAKILNAIRERVAAGTSTEASALWDAMRAEALKILEVDAAPLAVDHKPSLILVTGVNGVGKTTTIGKLASRYKAQGRRVLLAAGDTYRAAAVLQLEVWGQRVGCPVVKGKEGADPGSVIFEAISRAREEGYELVIADTAGRLHTKQPLMDELKKVDRTITKALGGRPADEILLVLDATTGQNAVQQMHMFREALNITGVVLTKLDGTAKGGVILGVVSEHKVPVRFVGLGERVEDLREFEAEGFVRALFERSNDENIAA